MKNILFVLAIGGFATMTSCSNSADEREKQAQQRTIDSMKMEMAHQRTIDSMNQVALQQQRTLDSMDEIARLDEEKAAAAAASRRSSSKSYASSTRSTSGTVSSNNVNSGYDNAPAAEPKKKGWSAKAKGAIIGTGVGAATGAIVNKRNRAAGAVIGGIGGAAVGTGVGAVIDKKKGR